VSGRSKVQHTARTAGKVLRGRVHRRRAGCLAVPLGLAGQGVAVQHRLAGKDTGHTAEHATRSQVDAHTRARACTWSSIDDTPMRDSCCCGEHCVSSATKATGTHARSAVSNGKRGSTSHARGNQPHAKQQPAAAAEGNHTR
jgi:hypothetical protein